MLDRIFDFLASVWSTICPVFIVPQYEQHVVLRYGRFHRELESGIHWRWPFIESVLSCSVVYTTSSLGNQTLQTVDGSIVTVSAAFRHRVSSARIYLLETEDAAGAVNDVVQIAVAEAIRKATWNEIIAQAFWEELTRQASNESRKWGVRITRVGYTDLAKIRVMRLLVDQVQFGGA